MKWSRSIWKKPHLLQRKIDEGIRSSKWLERPFYKANERNQRGRQEMHTCAACYPHGRKLSHCWQREPSASLRSHRNDKKTKPEIRCWTGAHRRHHHQTSPRPMLPAERPNRWITLIPKVTGHPSPWLVRKVRGETDVFRPVALIHGMS